MNTYSKPHLTYLEQIELLQSRGLLICDIKYATLKLQQISYYRLSAYFLPFYSDQNTFKVGTTFEHIIETYNFDKDLRILTFSAIEKIEIFLRTSIAYNFSKNLGSFAYLDEKNLCCKKETDFTWFIKDIRKESSRSKETFVKHFKSKYEQEELPIWMIVEIISFGTLSKLFTLICPNVEKEILKDLDLPSFVFKNWLHVFSYIRNTSAHHSRLWNRQFVIKAKIPKHKNELESLFDKYSATDISNMGFDNNWKKQNIWK
jgi:abortive infection bacteriophage resistance protein